MDEMLPLVKVLGVRHGDAFLGAPPIDVELKGGDEIVVYGHRDDIDCLNAR
jgi:Trk K+ transport system NAD-binding subunit